MTRSGWVAVAAVVAAMVLGNLIFLLLNRDADPGPRAVGGPEATATTPSAPAPTTTPPASATPAPTASARPGDGAPNHADNNGWKRRHELTAEEQAAGDELAALIRPKLDALLAAGDVAPDSTRQALLGVGIGADALVVTEVRTPIGETTTPPGAVFAVRFGQRGCVIGGVTPTRVSVQVTGSAAEFGCLEPFSH